MSPAETRAVAARLHAYVETRRALFASTLEAIEQIETLLSEDKMTEPPRLVAVMDGTTTWWAEIGELMTALEDWAIRWQDPRTGESGITPPIDPNTGRPHQDGYSLLCSAVTQQPAPIDPWAEDYAEQLADYEQLTWWPAKQEWILELYRPAPEVVA